VSGGGDGFDKTRRKLEEFERRMRQAHRKSLLLAAEVLQEKIKQTLSIPGTGRLYKPRGWTARLARKGTKRRANQDGRLHRASAPGEPPAVDTGFLRRSVVLNPQPDGRVRVGPAARYAAPLEFGTARILPRPFMQRSLDAASAEMTDVVVDALRAEAEKLAQED